MPIQPSGREIVLMPVSNGWVVFIPRRLERTYDGLNYDAMGDIIKNIQRDKNDLASIMEKSKEPEEPKYDFLKDPSLSIFPTLQAALDFISFTLGTM